MRRVPPFVSRVAVTRFSTDETLEAIASDLSPDYLQLHGGDTRNLIELKESLDDLPMIRAIDPLKEASGDELQASARFEAVLLDSDAGDGYGGTGRPVDWRKARAIRESLVSTPILLAGGLKPENVREAVSLVRPYGVDTSSGVEREPGRKDPDRMRRFVAEAKDHN